MDNSHTKPYQVIIIGAGAAGLMAAITAGRTGRSVLVIERNPAIGRKILVTGNGRCNLTNTETGPDKYYGQNTKCLHNIFSRFSCSDAIAFFEGLGVPLKTEEAGRVLPTSDQASYIVNAMGDELSRLKVTLKLEERLVSLSPKSGRWQAVTDKDAYQAKTIIIAAGGKSYPQLGSTGDGFDLAQKLGHSIIEPHAGLVPLELSGNWFRELQGVQSEVEMTLIVKGKTIRRTGQLLFTHFGISGPPVMDLSRLITANPESVLTANFMPAYKSAQDLTRFLMGHFQAQPQKTLLNVLSGFLPRKICAVLLNRLTFHHESRAGHMPKVRTQLIAQLLNSWPLEITGPRPFAESMVTAGGVPMDEVNTRTMESNKAKGVYLAGEVLDIDGISGGYNLQFAWSTGYLAGASAAQNLD
ncbi:MAG: NAD(P)/FAD-dependent oxidoreductase [Candidatus Brocadiia bacterium]